MEYGLCGTCNEEFGYYTRNGTHRKYCSRKCMGVAYKTQRIGKNNPIWKGKSVGYTGLHNWLRRKLGMPSKCSHCGTTEAKRFDWANVSGKYKRDLSDWIRLCASCHLKMDFNSPRNKKMREERSKRMIGNKYADGRKRDWHGRFI